MAAPKKKKAVSKGTSKKKPAASNVSNTPIRREIGAVICLFFGVISFFGCFNISAIFLDFFSDLTKGLLGWGYYILPLAFFVCSYILAFHRGRPVVMRVICTMLIPVVVGCLIHLVLCDLSFKFSFDMVLELWESGKSLKSGGLLCGFFSEVMEAMISNIVSGFIYVISLIFLILSMLNTKVADIADWFKSREVVEYELEPEPERLPENRNRKKGTKNLKKLIDIPVDDPPNVIQEEPNLKAADIVFNDKPNVRSPDKFYDIDGNEKKKETDEPDFLRNFEVPTVDDPIKEIDSPDSPQVIEQIINSIDEKKPKKIKAADVAAESETINKTIEEQNLQLTQEYKYPPLSLLKNSKNSGPGGKDEVAKNAERLSMALNSFGIDAKITHITRGPSVTRYELELEAGVKLNKLTNLADDLALSLGASGVRIAPIPDKISTVGVEVPNKLVSVVSLREVIASNQFQNAKSKLSFALGKDISGSPIIGDIAKLPHLLIAGTTGSGKSVCMNSLILSVLYKSSPEEVKFIMIDPKMVEFGVYNDIPHLLIPVVTDPKKAAGALQWAVTEMLRRYQKFSKTGLRDLTSYNKLAVQSDNEEDEVMPQIVIVIDELADLMLVASKEVEESICRVAQMGRASGIHLVIATQRPSADVITGLMKANIPSRIALAVSSSLESRIIMDTQGAEKLVGNGDMLYSPIGMNKPKRIQGTYVSDSEREKVIDFLKTDGEVHYSEEVSEAIEAAAAAEKSSGGKQDSDSMEDNDRDPLFDDAVQVVVELGQASVSMLQRKLKLGYSRAARLMDQMEEAEIVGPFEGSKPRQVLLSKEMFMQRKFGGDIDIPPFSMEPEFAPDNQEDEM